MLTHEIRDRFIQHFVKSGHTEVPSASLILDDPDLLFVNAGMVPFKPYFLGEQTPPFNTATSIQKCVRTLDIDEVGITTRHNTFFQMAGNFSFGDYFKQGAIRHAWSLLTNSLEEGGFGLDPQRLWVTVYLDDDEAAEIWEKEIGLPPERIQRLGMADNYWSMGIPGPSGPSSEIYYDRGPEHGKEGGPVVDDTRYIEIWNLVFMEKERGAGTGKDNFEIIGSLPKKNIDTGLGIERLACIMQNVDNVYETDLLAPVIRTAEKLSGAHYGSQGKDSIRFRVVADHSRTALMLILDGVTPSNEGRGYILRRLLRRIIRSMRLLGATQPVMAELMSTVRTTMTPSYPEIEENWDRILRVASAEEKTFLKTLESGTRLFDQIATEIKAEGKDVLPGEQAFILHDTHGFPLDLTLEMASEVGITVDESEFHQYMAEQKARAKADNQAKKRGHADVSVYRAFVDNHPTVFLGYESTEAEGRVLGLIQAGQLVEKAEEGQEIEIILDRTPFYAESGGQMADRGQITLDSAQVDILDVQKTGKKVWIHTARVRSGEIRIGDTAYAQVDKKWRHEAAQAHSGTHIIHAAIRQVLGHSAVQAGSLNKPGYLRFDFNYSEQLTPSQIADIEGIAHHAVDSDWSVDTIETSLEEAKAMGAMALFGESYGDQVRVVEIGGPFSIELCGGIHVDHSSQIGPISILGESSVGSNARRIEAYTGTHALKQLIHERDTLSSLASSLKVPTEQVTERIDSLSTKLKETEKQLESLKQAQLHSQVEGILSQAETIGEFRTILQKLPGSLPAKDLRSLAMDLKSRLGSEPAVILIASSYDGALPFIAVLNDAAVEKGISAGNLVKTFAPHVSGRGGGKAALAQGSGSQPEGVTAAFSAVRSELQG